MSQVALNTVAIFLFSITCLILVGPLMHIPAQIPVILVLAALSVGTADMFAFQGKGANLFLDWFAQRSPEYRNRIVHHEAGHFLVAHVLGISVRDYTLSAVEAIRAGYDGIGGVQFEPVKLSAEAPEQIKDYFAIAMAGRAAEKMTFDDIQGGLDDLAWVRDQSQQLNLNLTTYEQEALLKAKRLLKENWESYLRLVDAMKNRDSVAVCYAAIAGDPAIP